MALIDSLIQEGWLKTPGIIEAFKAIKRIDFLPEDSRDLAELDTALPIGYSQTISQPLVVAFMLELLSPQSGEKILDIGSGSGWTTALLAHLVSQKGGNQISKDEPVIPSFAFSPELSKNQKGRIIAIEIVPELKEFGEKNVAKYNFIEKGIVEFLCADGSKGYEKEAPYDKILASASVQGKIPEAWKKQLKVGGRIVTPVGNSIWLLRKKKENEFEEKEYPGFIFVPLIKR
jgi:protein-L-isoaspartate(D-aspartate) O-methyltransferase